jgi:hypothetical protein
MGFLLMCIMSIEIIILRLDVGIHNVNNVMMV